MSENSTTTGSPLDSGGREIRVDAVIDMLGGGGGGGGGEGGQGGGRFPSADVLDLSKVTFALLYMEWVRK